MAHYFECKGTTNFYNKQIFLYFFAKEFLILENADGYRRMAILTFASRF